jgi:dTMP kinase
LRGEFCLPDGRAAAIIIFKLNSRVLGARVRQRAEYNTQGTMFMLQASGQYPGRLFVVEGIDGSGKSTQIRLLYKWLLSMRYSTFFSEWNSSPLVKRTTRRGKRKHLLTPLTFSLIHATDFADRTERNIIPPLKAGAAVLADRYIYTALARDAARGCDPAWIRATYSFAVKPTVGFYFRVPLEIAVERILEGRPELKYYEAGMDMNLSEDPYESFRLFQARIVAQYESMVDECGLTVIDGTLPIIEQQRTVRQIIEPFLDGLLRMPEGAWMSPLEVGDL